MKKYLLLVFLCTGPLHAADNAREWLHGMSEALNTLDYDGTFVYQHDGKLDVMTRRE